MPSLEDVEEVDYPPPPARIETIDPLAHQDDGCVWVDGTWHWNGRRWAWEPGAWVLPPGGCYYAAGDSFWQPNDEGPAVLFYRKPAWYPHSASGAPATACPSPKRCD